ncbi:MAG: SpaH/EbpB family LPXTG-anchored major pilin [Lachnospiraceae bacterium]|nr:SpaH/EbpB family LPXTG-anchored major pilin [Lachnospiraceae bacterium]
MKQFKKLASLLLALIMVLSMTSTAFAENEPTHTITITNEKEKEGHTYEAYQVFAGDISAGKLTNIEWGSGVDGDEVLDALKEMTESPYADCSSAQAVADVLAGFNNNSAQLDAFAAIVGQHLATVAGTSTATASPYEITVTGDGYYLVKDKDTSLNEGEDAYTKYILEVIKDVTVTAKADVPTIDKKIVVDDDEETTTANAAVGDTINYKLTSKVPAMDGYEKYFFIVHDTMTKGLTFDEDSVKVEIGETELTEGEDYEVESSNLEATGETNIEIIFKNFIAKKNDKGKDIIITYSAQLNENAVIGVEGNPNKVTLEYSNNPYVKDEGEPDNSDKPTEPTGKTPEKETYTYVTGIELIKIDGSSQARLAGAEFKITGDKLNKVLVRKDVFTESDEGTYYKLKDGSYTEEAPNGQTEHDDKYESTTTTYVKSVQTEIVTTGSEVTAEAVVGPDGILRFEGLAAGDYEITEIKAPNGYNLLSDPISVNITWEAPTGDESKDCTWSSDTDDAIIVDGLIQLTVENKTGAQLPSTGGMGTTIFYAAGIILMAGAVFFVIRRKRA